MRILITGAAGQVGHKLIAIGLTKGHEILSFTRTEFDITDKSSVVSIISQLQPDVVINPAAYTAVDKAECETDIAFSVNRDGPENLAIACSSRHIPLIHISTDYVFDGIKTSPYVETDPVNPVNAYGRSKEAGEAAIRDVLEQHIIVRTSWVFSSHGTNFVRNMIRLGKERDLLRIVDDQKGGPTSAYDIAGAAINIAEHVILSRSQPWGTYHFSGAPETTWYAFAQAIFESAAHLTGKVPAVEPITTEEYPTPAVRPRNSVMNCDKIFKVFGIFQPSWRISLDKLIC